MQKLSYYLRDPKRIIAGLVFRLHFLFSDKVYLSILFWAKMGYRLDLKNPRTFSEKLQWLKLYDRNPLHTQLVDKILVKEHVRNVVGDAVVIPTLSIWNTVDEIDISLLPDQFVLKTSNGGGSNGVIVCKDKSMFNINDAKKMLAESLHANIYSTHREWPYKNIQPRVFAEKYMVDESGYELKDYKFLCFNGHVKALFIASDRYKGEHETRFDYYDENFNYLELKQSHPNSVSPNTIPPKAFNEMKDIAEKLSKGFRHVRIDLYCIESKVYFGEMTFFHYSGLQPFYPSKWDRVWGDWLEL